MRAARGPFPAGGRGAAPCEPEESGQESTAVTHPSSHKSVLSVPGIRFPNSSPCLWWDLPLMFSRVWEAAITAS